MRKQKRSTTSVPAKEDLARSLIHAFRNGGAEAVKQLFAAGVDVNVRGHEDQTPLHMAVWHIGMVRLLLEMRADVNAKDSTGSTPLHVASLFDQPDAVSLLIAAGADLNIRDSRGRTPLQEAVYLAPLHEAAYKASCAEPMSLLLDAGADATVKDEEGRTPLDMLATKIQSEKKVYGPWHSFWNFMKEKHPGIFVESWASQPGGQEARSMKKQRTYKSTKKRKTYKSMKKQKT